MGGISVVAILILAGIRRRRGQSTYFFSQHHLALCSVDQMLPFIQEKRLEEVFPWKVPWIPWRGWTILFPLLREAGGVTFTAHLRWVPPHLGHSKSGLLNTSLDAGVAKHIPATETSSRAQDTVCAFAQSSLLQVPADAFLAVFKFSERPIRKKACS